MISLDAPITLGKNVGNKICLNKKNNFAAGNARTSTFRWRSTCACKQNNKLSIKSSYRVAKMMQKRTKDFVFVLVDF